ncbi:pilus assembly protein FilA [Acinetobacter sp. VNK23]|uniref:putative pilus system protein FilA n=1 Tax=Acinetobacter thutiue TaxID=2998078 RepID=UPI002576C735|nr:DUF6160 family protein [Acinetobacter thutiue]MDM1021912.1 pilus assembly protein FilA [Acinetobacter thutiue]
MKMFTKLALVSSMAISANAMAMQSMDDAALSAATGQDGINLGIGISKIEIEKVLIHDNDGLSATAKFGGWTGDHDNDTGTADTFGGQTSITGGKAAAGAIVIKGDGKGAVAEVLYTAGDAEVIAGTKAVGDVKVAAKAASVTETNGVVISANAAALLDSHNLADITIDTDAGTGNTSTGTGTAFLNISAAVSGLNINIGEIGVSESNTATTSVRRGAKDAGAGSNYNKILSGLALKTGRMAANIQLGAAPQGAMIVLNTSMTGGLEITDLGILDNSTKLGTGAITGAGNRAAGEIRLDSIKVADANGADLTVNAKVNVIGESDAGKGYLRIITGSGATTPATDIYIKGVHLGSASAGSIGDVEVQGLQTYYSPSAGVYTKGSVITVSGH